jgi:hypothetical protein
MARPVGRLSVAWATGCSLLVSLGFLTVASWLGEAPVSAIAGGTAWVFILSMIVSTPAIAAWMKRPSADSRHRGGAT